MKLFTKDILAQLAENGLKADDNPDFDPKPVVKLFTPDAAATWLLAWTLPDEPDIAFGLCDLGMGFPECGTVSLNEIQSLRGKLGLPVERDLHFEAVKPLSVYTSEAMTCGSIRA